MELIHSAIIIGSIVAAIIAWLAKLRWSKEFEKAKTEVIRAKDAQIETLEKELNSLKEMTPMK